MPGEGAYAGTDATLTILCMLRPCRHALSPPPSRFPSAKTATTVCDVSKPCRKCFAAHSSTAGPALIAVRLFCPLPGRGPPQYTLARLDSACSSRAAVGCDLSVPLSRRSQGLGDGMEHWRVTPGSTPRAEVRHVPPIRDEALGTGLDATDPTGQSTSAVKR